MDTAVHETATTLGADLLFREHAAFVASFLRRLGALPDEIDDLVQEGSGRASPRGFTPGAAQPRTWLAEIGRRLVCSMRRTSKRRQTTTAPELVASVPATTASPFDTAAAVEALRRVQQAILALDLDHRTVFILYELEGDSCDSIAAAMEIPVGTVHSRLHAARRGFRIAYRKPRPTASPRGRSSRCHDEGPHSPPRGSELAPRATAGARALRDRSPAGLRCVGRAGSVSGFGRVPRSSVESPPAGSGAPSSAIAISTKLVVYFVATALLGIGVAAWIAARATHQAVALFPRSGTSYFRDVHPQSSPSLGVPRTFASDDPRVGIHTDAAFANGDSRVIAGTDVDASVAPQRPAATGGRTDRTAHDPAFDELRQVARLRELSETNPTKAIEIADEGNRMFPNGLLYQERESIAIRALVQVRRRSEAQARAQRLLDAFPRGPFSALVRRETGLEP